MKEETSSFRENMTVEQGKVQVINETDLKDFSMDIRNHFHRLLFLREKPGNGEVMESTFLTHAVFLQFHCSPGFQTQDGTFRTTEEDQ